MIQLYQRPAVKTVHDKVVKIRSAHAMPTPSSALPLNRTKRMRFAMLTTTRHTVSSCTSRSIQHLRNTLQNTRRSDSRSMPSTSTCIYSHHEVEKPVPEQHVDQRAKPPQLRQLPDGVTAPERLGPERRPSHELVDHEYQVYRCVEKYRYSRSNFTRVPQR